MIAKLEEVLQKVFRKLLDLVKSLASEVSYHDDTKDFQDVRLLILLEEKIYTLSTLLTNTVEHRRNSTFHAIEEVTVYSMPKRLTLVVFFLANRLHGL